MKPGTDTPTQRAPGPHSRGRFPFHAAALVVLCPAEIPAVPPPRVTGATYSDAMTSVRTLAVSLAAALALTGCATPTDQADPCDDATSLATEAYDGATRALNNARNVRPEPVDPNLARTPREGEYISDHAEAKFEAERRADRLRDSYQTDARRLGIRWATIIDQNPDCFTVQERADAAEMLRAATG